MPENCFNHSADKLMNLAQSSLPSPVSKAQMLTPISFPAKDPHGKNNYLCKWWWCPHWWKHWGQYARWHWGNGWWSLTHRGQPHWRKRRWDPWRGHLEMRKEKVTEQRTLSYYGTDHLCQALPNPHPDQEVTPRLPSEK